MCFSPVPPLGPKDEDLAAISERRRITDAQAALAGRLDLETSARLRRCVFRQHFLPSCIPREAFFDLKYGLTRYSLSRCRFWHLSGDIRPAWFRSETVSNVLPRSPEVLRAIREIVPESQLVCSLLIEGTSVLLPELAIRSEITQILQAQVRRTTRFLSPFRQKSRGFSLPLPLSTASVSRLSLHN